MNHNSDDRANSSSQRTLFKIGELSKLFATGEDSIRYYERIGLLHPVRNPDNNYRYYTLDDVRTMNTIRELLDLGFSTKEILAFEKDRSLKHVTDMLEQEAEVIDRQIASLKSKKSSLEIRLRTLNENLHRDCSGCISVLELPPRPVLMITESDMPDPMINYELARFLSNLPQSKNPAVNEERRKVITIGACDCYTINLNAFNRTGTDYRTKNVFFYSPYLTEGCNYTLPGGTWLSASYRGDYIGTKKLLPRMLAYAGQQHLSVVGDPIEFCHIDRYETSVKEEYLTELQVPVSESF